MPSRARFRPWRALAAAARGAGVPVTCALLAIACAPPGPRRVEGGATGWLDRAARPELEPGTAAAATARPDAAPSPWERAAEIATFKPATGRGRSQHFTGELEAEVQVDATASTYPALGPDRVLPPGAALVELHYPPGASEPSAVFAMEKRAPGYDVDGGDWEYVILTPAGRTTHRGPLPLCKRCHAEAPNDHLFGGPR